MLNPPTQKAPGIATPKGAGVQMVMLFLYMVINFADKLVLQIAAGPIRAELHLTPEEYGAVGSYFFLALSIAGLAMGFLANHRPTTILILLMALSWAFVQFPMVGTVGFTTIVICRILLGLGEGGAAAVATHAIYKWYPDHRRGMPTAWLSNGSAIGVIIAAPSLNWLIVHYSWHAAFGALGAIGLIWSLAWYFIGREGPLVEPVASVNAADRVPYLALFTSRTFIGCVIACFGAYWSLSLGLTWFVPFLTEGLGMSQSLGGNLAILPWVIGAITVLCGGVVSQFLVGRGVATRVSRGMVGTLPMVVGGVLLLAMPLIGGGWPEIGLLVLGTGLTGPIYVVASPMIGEFTPQSQRAGTIATFGAIYAIAGIIAPSVMGTLVQNGVTPLAGYHSGFMVSGVMLLGCGLVAMVLLAPAACKARMLRLRGA